MKDFINNVVGPFIAIVVIAGGFIILFSMILNSCAASSERYYAAEAACVGAGGSWIASGEVGHCIAPKDKQ